MSKNRIALILFLLLFVAASVWLALSYKDALGELSHRNTHKAVLEKDIEELRKEANQNRIHLEKLRKNPDFQDATARQELGYGRQGERVYRFPRKKIKNIYKMETKEPKKEVITSAERATEEGNLMLSSLKNISEFIKTDTMPSWVSQAIIELIEDENWEELNNRFHENLAFGTGGMRGRTIGKTVTKSEMGSAKEGESPTFAAVGTNTLNELTVIRATKALFMYVRQWMAENGILEQPRLVVAHDIRHFSAKFTELTVNTWAELGGFAMTFDGPRSTPQLSFTVRNRYSHAGVVITASHNPYHDNGFKVYFSDGAQIVAPHANHIIENYNRISLKEVIKKAVKCKTK